MVIPEIVEQIGFLIGGGAVTWLTWLKFFKKHVTENAETNIYQIQSDLIKDQRQQLDRLSDRVELLNEKIITLERQSIVEARNFHDKIITFEKTLSELERQALVQAQIDQAGRDGLLDRRKKQDKQP